MQSFAFELVVFTKTKEMHCKKTPKNTWLQKPTIVNH